MVLSSRPRQGVNDMVSSPATPVARAPNELLPFACILCLLPRLNMSQLINSFSTSVLLLLLLLLFFQMLLPLLLPASPLAAPDATAAGDGWT